MRCDHAIIAAHDQSLGIGKNNKLPWHIKGDLKYFQNITSQIPPAYSQGKEIENAVIMGRNTWQSIPDTFKPLKGRLNLVLTKSNSFTLPENVWQSQSLEKALELLGKQACARIFVIGGAAVYAEAIKIEIFRTLYITEIEGLFDCDTFFPDYRNVFTLLDSSPLIVENNYSYRFKTYGRNESRVK